MDSGMAEGSCQAVPGMTARLWRLPIMDWFHAREVPQLGCEEKRDPVEFLNNNILPAWNITIPP